MRVFFAKSTYLNRANAHFARFVPPICTICNGILHDLDMLITIVSM